MFSLELWGTLDAGNSIFYVSVYLYVYILYSLLPGWLPGLLGYSLMKMYSCNRRIVPVNTGPVVEDLGHRSICFNCSARTRNNHQNKSLHDLSEELSGLAFRNPAAANTSGFLCFSASFQLCESQLLGIKEMFHILVQTVIVSLIHRKMTRRTNPAVKLK